jgi:hypothetical protein
MPMRWTVSDFELFEGLGYSSGLKMKSSRLLTVGIVSEVEVADDMEMEYKLINEG